MKKIILIDPEGIRLGLNIGLGYIAANLKKNNYRVNILDFNNERIEKREALKQVKDADFIGISIKTFIVSEALKLAKAVREINPGAVLISGGPHLSIDGFNFIKENKIFDIGIAGEGEQSFLELAKGKPKNEIGGIIFNNGGQTAASGNRPYNINLDDLPFPDYNLFNSHLHNGIAYRFSRNAYPIFTSRGCPFKCVYCASYISMGRTWRARSVKNILEELKKAKTDYDISRFEILDDNFNIDPERTKDFCREVSSLKLRWSCPSGLRADSIDNELVRLMKEAGCYYVYLGIETGDEAVYSKLGKGGSLSRVKEAVKLFKSQGIRVAGAFIIGLPDTTKAIDQESLRFSKKIKLDQATFAMLQPFYNTPVYNLLKKDPLVKMLYPWSNVIPFGPDIKTAFETASYTAQDRIKMYSLANLRSKSYVAFIKQNGNAWEKARKIIIAILRFDTLYLFYHLFWVTFLGIRSKTRKLNLID